jgi:hypothetical protein
MALDLPQKPPQTRKGRKAPVHMNHHKTLSVQSGWWLAELHLRYDKIQLAETLEHASKLKPGVCQIFLVQEYTVSTCP